MTGCLPAKADIDAGGDVIRVGPIRDIETVEIQADIFVDWRRPRLQPFNAAAQDSKRITAVPVLRWDPDY